MVNLIVVGAHYGLRDWILQRATAVIMAIYTVGIVLALLAIPGTHEGWKAFFACTAVRVVTQVTLIVLFAHVWVGMRDLWMDYIKPVGLRLTMHVFTIVWLVGTLVYSVKVVWGM